MDKPSAAPSIGARVLDAEGAEGQVVSVLEEKTLVRLGNGVQMLVPTDAMTRTSDGAYRLPFTLASLQTAAQELVIPVIREELDVQKRVVETGGGVRIIKTVRERTELIDEPLTKDEVLVERRPIETLLGSDRPTVRYEGQTLVIPVIEEVLSVQKQWILREEVRITRRTREVRETQEVTLRSEEVAVERFDPPTDKG